LPLVHWPILTFLLSEANHETIHYKNPQWFQSLWFLFMHDGFGFQWTSDVFQCEARMP
jgi:hypothetical protein